MSCLFLIFFHLNFKTTAEGSKTYKKLMDEDFLHV